VSNFIFLLIYFSSQRQTKTVKNQFQFLFKKKKTAKKSKEETKEGTKEQLCYLTEISSPLKI